MVAQEQIMEWAKHPDLLDKESLYELRKVVNAYPYFQLARILFLKNLYLLNMPEFKAELKKGVLYVADVSVLFYYLEGEKFAVAKHTDEAERTKYSETDRTLALIDSFLKDDDEPIPENVKLVPEVPVDYTSLLLAEDVKPEESVPLMKGHDLIDDFLKQAEDDSRPLYRFDQESTPEGNQADDAGHDAPTTEAAGKETAVAQVHDASNEWDDNEGQTDDDDQEEVSTEPDEDSSFSETLAKIYVKQQKYEKALEIIKKLNLKYPKKNAYFADQIRFLEKLIINTKSK